MIISLSNSLTFVLGVLKKRLNKEDLFSTHNIFLVEK